MANKNDSLWQYENILDIKYVNRLVKNSLVDESYKHNQEHCKEDIFPIEYNINSYGFRSKEFSQNDGQRALALGCSQTFGFGLQEEYTWSQILSNKLNIDIDNLAQGGDSTMGQIRKCFAYFKMFGHPKAIFCLFPIRRMQMPIIIDKNRPVHNYTSSRQYEIERLFISDDNFSKYSKAPHIVQELIGEPTALFFDHVFIEMLEQYCESNNILFAWSFWERYDYIYEEVRQQHPEIYKNYCDQVHTIQYPLNNLKCHSEYSHIPTFNVAADRKIGPGHFGIHANLHIAESFYDKIKDR